MKMHKYSVQAHPSASRGFTLLVVLVALLVLSIGLLGLAGMQTLSLKNNNSALMRSQAVVLAYVAESRQISGLVKHNPPCNFDGIG